MTPRRPELDRGTPLPGRRARQRGLTLVETLIVVALIALMGGAVIYGSGMLTSSRQRAAATLIASAVRMGITRANTSGRPVRLVFDLEKHRVALEETRGVMLRKKEEKNTGGGAEAATDVEKQASAEASRILEGPRAPKAEFSPVKQFGFDGDDPAAGRELGAGVKFKQVQTDHDEEPRTGGRAYLYFWPGGGTERAVVQIVREGDKEGLSVVVSPLTGRAKIARGAVAIEGSKSDEEFGQTEEEER
ncbi:MAG: prepilin-type N-terminal cleavage/methylation domain-containing protein [Myxococcales bacterium]|nr:prepilin-type N-terminal cleavage/methylation domain-containing protein [Myxococcales bacterium]